jgi:hypothetical protein
MKVLVGEIVKDENLIKRKSAENLSFHHCVTAEYTVTEINLRRGLNFYY